jgi:hypothetical protein
MLSATSPSPIARFARWFTEERGMKCPECGARLEKREDQYCSQKHAEAWLLGTAV